MCFLRTYTQKSNLKTQPQFQYTRDLLIPFRTLPGRSNDVKPLVVVIIVGTDLEKWRTMQQSLNPESREQQNRRSPQQQRRWQTCPDTITGTIPSTYGPILYFICSFVPGRETLNLLPRYRVCLCPLLGRQKPHCSWYHGIYAIDLFSLPFTPGVTVIFALKLIFSDPSLANAIVSRPTIIPNSRASRTCSIISTWTRREPTCP